MITRRQTDAEFAAQHDAIRSTIDHLCRAYDSGGTVVAFALATEIMKFLTTGDKITSVQVPRNKRATYNRRELIMLVRNKLGAHLDRELPEDLDRLQRSEAFGISVVVDQPGHSLSTVDGSLPMRIGPLPAMVRQIAYEVLQAFPEQAERTNA